MNLSYRLIRNLCYSRVFGYISQGSSVKSMHIYRDFRRHKYSTFNPFYTCTFVLCLGFTSNMMSKNLPSISIRINLSSSMSALGYYPGKWIISTYTTSCALMTRLVNKVSGKCSIRTNLLWLCSIYGVVHLCTSFFQFSAPLLVY